MQSQPMPLVEKTTALKPAKLGKPLKGITVLSLALNLPGPAALMRCRQMGARCIKLEPPSGDPMSHYNMATYAQMHDGVTLVNADLKTPAGQAVLQHQLAKADVLVTSFRPSATEKLGMGWRKLHRLFPALSHVAIVGAPGARAEEAGHDLTYIAEAGLLPSLELPATLYADMGGSLMASEAVLQAVMLTRTSGKGQGKGIFMEIALSDAAAYLALPRHWGLTQTSGMVGGAHAGYGVYACQDGRVALAALEPHFALRLCAVVGVTSTGGSIMLESQTRRSLEAFFAGMTCSQVDQIASAHDLPLHTLPNK